MRSFKQSHWFGVSICLAALSFFPALWLAFMVSGQAGCLSNSHGPDCGNPLSIATFLLTALGLPTSVIALSFLLFKLSTSRPSMVSSKNPKEA